MTATLSEAASATCAGANGTLRIAYTGTPTHYRLNGGAWTAVTASPMLVSVPAGEHSVELKNGNCISAIVKQVISNPINLTASVDGDPTAASCGANNGTIKLTVSGATVPITYSVDGGIHFHTLNPSTMTITGLAAGIYDIVIESNYCRTNIFGVEVRQGLNYSIIAAPSATTPQTFCSTTATVANLQAAGTGIVWYLTATGGMALSPTTPLNHGTIYYASQTAAGGCESAERTAVKVIIDNTVLIDMPNIPNEVLICSGTPPATLADIPTNGNTNIVWYSSAVGGIVLPITTPLQDGVAYYAGIVIGTCQSIQRAEVIVSIVSGGITAPTMETPQTFCEGALVGNLATPNNQIRWYAAATGGTPLEAGTKLVHNTTYYAAQKAGDCESATRTPVTAMLTGYVAPVAPPVQSTCNATYLSDLMITGVNIKWYNAATGGAEYTSPATTAVTPGVTYYAAQSVGNCESPRIGVTITSECYSPYGTVFPFVYTGDAIFDSQFVTMAKLYLLPPTTVADKIGYLRKQAPMRQVQVERYDCAVDPAIVGAPKHPGTISSINNPGLPIRWNVLGYTLGTVNNDKLSLIEKCPDKEIGRFTFTDIAPGTYAIEISRQGFLPRYGAIVINGSNYLEHRELVGGDLNGDLTINEKDLSALSTRKTNYGTSSYAWKYDLDGDAQTGNNEQNIIRINLGAIITIYQETLDLY
jgi:hypothetical protein